MEKRLRCSILQLAAFFLLSSGIVRGALVEWAGGPIVVTNVVDQNIDISNNNIMQSDITVSSVNADIVITVTSGDAAITSTVNNTTFCLSAAAGHTITMDLANALFFIAGSNLTTPFIITFTGPGSLVVNINGNAGFVLTTQSSSVGTQFFLVMDPTNPKVRFQRMATTPTNNNSAAFVLIDSRCLMSYLAVNSVASGLNTELGTIQMNPTLSRAFTGNFITVISDTGAFIISGHQMTPGACPHAAAINLAVPAGLEATLEVMNTSPGNSWGGYILDNANQTYSPQLLINPFCLTSTYSGLLYGFTLQANGQVVIDNHAYMLFAGGAVNVPPVTDQQFQCNLFLHQIVKDRNPSAFVVDGNLTTTNAIPAQIFLNGESAIYFASLVNCLGCNVLNSSNGVVTSSLAPQSDIPGAGNIVFDVEGELNVFGDPNTINTALNVLSLVVSFTGGSVLIDGNSTIFPLRTFLTNPDGSYQRFPKSCFLINNVMHLSFTNLKHDDESHRVTLQFLPDNTLLQDPEPTYIGGERDVLITPSVCPLQVGLFSDTIRSIGMFGGDSLTRLFPQFGCFAPANIIDLLNSNVLVHTSLDATGLTFRVPQVEVIGNVSSIVMYSNGYCIDQGNGRNFVLGSLIGSLATDGSHIIDPSAYIDVIQTTTATLQPHELTLSVGYNNQKVTEGLTYNINGQDVVQTIALLYNSNICIGTNQTVTPSPFPLVTFPTVNIEGNYYSFITQGGQLLNPSASGSTGQGGIYVDSNGIFAIKANLRALMGLVVAKSGNGVVDLPDTQVLFWQTVGVQQWNLNLTDTSQQLVVGPAETYSDYTMDWATVTQDFCPTSTTMLGYLPYQKPETGFMGCPVLAYAFPVLPANLQGLPTVQGTVDQFQIKNSRVGNQAQLLVDGGLVREVVFLNGTLPGVSPIGTIVVQNDGIVGIGTAERNVDSLQASIVLGVNGVTLVANGNGQVMLNEDIIINNLCHVLTGTNFGVSGPQQLLITSEVPRELRVKGTGILDLTQFGNYNQRLAIGGQVKVVFEPGARLVMGSGEFFFIDNAQMTFQPFVDFAFPAGTSAASTDPYRVKFSTVLTTTNPSRLTFKEGSRMFIPRGAVVGVEFDSCATGTAPVTTISQSWLITDEGRIEIGNASEYGGALQIGNTSNAPSSVIDWALTLSGQGAVLELGSQAFLGFGLGIANKPNSAPDTWLIDTLKNVRSISITNIEGTIAHQSIYAGSNNLASLLAYGPASGAYTLQFDRVNGETLGGGNIVTTGTQTATGGFHPVVGTTGNVDIVTTNTGGQPVVYRAGILASETSLLDYSKTPNSTNPVIVTGPALTLFTYMGMNDYTQQNGRTAVVVNTNVGIVTVGYVLNNVIARRVGTHFRYGTVSIGPEQAVQIGTAGLALDLSSTPPGMTLSILNP